MRVLVTGGAGFIGSALVRYLVKDVGAEVLTFDKLTYAGNRASLKAVENSPSHRLLEADICNAREVASALEQFRPDHIYHLAAETHVDRSIDGAAQFLDTNVVGTYTMLEAARRHWLKLNSADKAAFRFVHVSTDEVYGSLGPTGKFTEDTPYDPSSPYSASKAASDHLAVAWHRTYGLPVVISNCSNNYGPHQFPEKLIPLTILNALHGQPLPVYGNGSNVRDWLYVEDHVRALHLIAHRGRLGAKYNVGGGNERRNIEVVQAICRILDSLRPRRERHETLLHYVTDRPGHDYRYAMDAHRLESELGWRAQVDFDRGVEATVLWYLDNEQWWGPLRRDVYAGERIGASANAV